MKMMLLTKTTIHKKLLANEEERDRIIEAMLELNVFCTYILFFLVFCEKALSDSRKVIIPFELWLRFVSFFFVVRPHSAYWRYCNPALLLTSFIKCEI